MSFKGKNSIKCPRCLCQNIKILSLYYWKFSVLSNYFCCVDNENANISFTCSKWEADEAFSFTKIAKDITIHKETKHISFCHYASLIVRLACISYPGRAW